jgi:hypothetical protein
MRMMKEKEGNGVPRVGKDLETRMIERALDGCPSRELMAHG